MSIFMTIPPESVMADITSDAIPADAAMVMSALEAGTSPVKSRRAIPRFRYRVAATIRLFSDDPAAAPSLIYTRDVNRRSLGFITPHRLALGHGGIIELPGPAGEPLKIHCTLLRCRETVPGWFEGSVYFNREQMQFELG